MLISELHNWDVSIKDKEKIEYVLRSRKNVKPVFLSPGYLIDCQDSLKYTILCLSRYRIPEPVRQAHMLVTRLRNDS